MNSIQISQSMEMYLKALFEFSGQDPATPARLAERLGVTNVSANEMVHRLDELGLVSHVPYHGVTLTEKGMEIASNVLRRQRLWECFLHDHLKIEWAKIYDLSCELEHATAPEVTEALAEFLGDPKTCPRGNPIPAVDGSFTPLDGISLKDAAVGSTVTIVAVKAIDSKVLKYLQDRRILPGSIAEVVEAAPLQGPLTLLLHELKNDGAPAQEVVVGLVLAEYVIVRPYQ